ncbi:glycosyltransferase family 1 protein [Brasilonema octagenarum UFV-E1]|uniref:Glycosyltransferase family 1 protein n=1 Tax=Brasilonema sennae CENA114 TaxID=415709 RepID=A0A856MGH1_9CYAN|nr:glycosyltransferase family 1 protein [Brasilonema sennae]QDL09330.1 glycosyltransferase family 1 protein [Brasilonema sennae CENA114]QDL15687.1 glycosyltransferase family 1 protein [Brasilonema octagenarum UFV-E1]
MHILIAALHRPTKPTGVCRHAVNLAQCLVDTDQVTKVTLVVGAWQKDYFEKTFNLSSQKINLLSVDIKNSSVSRNLWFLFGLPKLAKQLHSNIVHLSFPLPFLRSLFPCPVVTTIHDLYPYEYPENFGYPNVIFNQLFLKQCINNSDGLSCVSKQTLEFLKIYFPHIEQRKKTTVVYNYVDFSQIKPRVPKNIESSINTPFLLAVAQHRKNKNLDILIQTYSLLLKNNQLKDSTKLILVGSSGPETENICHQIRTLSLEERVLMLSSIDDDELCWLYQNCELLVVPSSTEGFCLPLAEALYLSCKVVCSDIPIFREIGSSNCTYFELQNDSVENLSQAIIQCLAQPDSDYKYPDYSFSKSNAAYQYINFYSTLI